MDLEQLKLVRFQYGKVSLLRSMKKTQMREDIFAGNARSTLCGERCRKASKKAARQKFEGKNKELDCEHAYDREYMFWYNRIAKLKKNSAPLEQIERAKAALKQFRSEALKRKQLVK